MNDLLGRLHRHSHLTAALLFLGLALLFFARVLWLPDGEVLAGHDMIGMYAIYWGNVRDALLSGRLPLWEPDIFGGFPFLAQPQQMAFYPLNWLNLVFPLRIGISLSILFHVWLAGFGMYSFTRAMGSRWLPAILAGLGFAYGGLLAGRLWAGHTLVVAGLAWTPVMLLALVWAIRRGNWAAAVLAGLPFGMAILAGHIPSFLYIGLIWSAFVVYLFLTSGSDRWLVIKQAAIAAAVGLALAAVQLVPFIQFSLSSGRVSDAGYEFATDYSFPPAHLITLLIPEFFGEPLRTGYWSVPTFEELTYYAGLLAILGILLALRRPTRLTWFYIVLIVLGLWLALGKYGVLYELAYQYVLPFRLVRAPGRAAFLFLFAASALLAHTLSHWRTVPITDRRADLKRYWPWVLAVLGIALFSGLAATGAVFMSVHPTDTSGRLWHQIGGYSLALVVVGAGGALLWAYLTADSRCAPYTLNQRGIAIAVALIALVVTDTWWVSFKMVRASPNAPEAIWTDGKALVGETGGRVLPWGLSIFSQNGAMQVNWPSVFGYDPLEPAAHIALASSVPDPRSTAYDILGATHVLAWGPLDDFTSGERPLTLLGQQGAAWVYSRARPLPLARLVYGSELIPDAAAAIARIHAPDFDPATMAILEADPGCEIGPLDGPAGAAAIEQHDSTYWRILTRSERPALLILAENAYPGWEVTVDGQSARPLTAYTSIRAVCVPAGEHVVEWSFAPRIYWVGGAVTLLALGLVIIATIATRRRKAGVSAA